MKHLDHFEILIAFPFQTFDFRGGKVDHQIATSPRTSTWECSIRRHRCSQLLLPIHPLSGGESSPRSPHFSHNLSAYVWAQQPNRVVAQGGAVCCPRITLIFETADVSHRSGYMGYFTLHYGSDFSCATRGEEPYRDRGL